MTRKSVAGWVSEERQETYDALRHDIFKREREAIPDTIGGVAKVKVEHVSVEPMPDSIPAMPSGKVRTVLKAVPDNVRMRSADSKCAMWTRTDPKCTEYKYNDKGELVRRFTDGYGNDPWQLVGRDAVDAIVSTPYVFKPSGKPPKAWRKGNERPIIVDKLGRKVTKL
jgi:hypothetical protein